MHAVPSIWSIFPDFRVPENQQVTLRSCSVVGRRVFFDKGDAEEAEDVMRATIDVRFDNAHLYLDLADGRAVQFSACLVPGA